MNTFETKFGLKLFSKPHKDQDIVYNSIIIIIAFFY